MSHGRSGEQRDKVRSTAPGTVGSAILADPQDTPVVRSADSSET